MRRPPSRPIVAVACLAAFLALSANASAHEIIPGIEGFPALMLHPFVVPEQIACLIAAALVAGRMAREAFLRAFAAMLAGVLAGKAAHLAIPWLSMYWFMPMVFTLAAGLTVAMFRRVALLPGIVLIFLLMFAYSVAIVPEEATVAGLYQALSAAMVTAGLVFVIASLPLTFVATEWGSIAIRIGGAWVAAVSLLYLALSWRLVAGTIG